MASGNAYDSLRAAANTWAAQQRFDAPVAMAEVATPTAPGAGSNVGLFYHSTDGRPRHVNDAGVTYDLGAWRRDAGTTHIRPESATDALVIGGTAAPHASIGLDLAAANRALGLSRAFDVPQVLGLPPNGTIAYDTETHTVQVMINGVWTALGASSSNITLLVQLGGRDQDVLPNHVFALGRGCCQIIAFAAEAGGTGILTSTSHPNKGSVFLGIIEYDEVNHRLGIGAYPPLYTLDVPAGTTRLNTGWTGLLRADAGVVSVDSGGGGGSGGWTDAGAVLHPTTTSDGVALGATSLATSAQLEGVSTSRGWLPPRLSTAQIDAIASPAEGLILYDTTVHKLRARDNSAWKYLQFEAGGGGGPTLLIEDLFTGTGALTVTTTGGSLGAVSWNAATGTLDRSTDVARATAFPARWWVEASDADVTVQANFAVVNQGQELVFRYVDASNYLYVENTSNTSYRLRAMVAGTPSTIQSISLTPVNNDEIKVTCAGSSITVFVNSASQGAQTSTTHQSATKHGVGTQNLGGAGNSRWDNFRVYSA